MSDRRVRPPADMVSVMETLIEQGLFQSKYQVLGFAAALGVRAEASLKLGKSGEGIRRDHFEGASLDLVWDVAAIVTGKDLRIAGEDRLEERIDCFESYAYGGLQLIKDECFDAGTDALEGLMRLVTRFALRVEEPEVLDLF